MSQFIKVTTKIVINGREYKSLEEMPEADRQFFLDQNKNGIPDGLEQRLTPEAQGLLLRIGVTEKLLQAAGTPPDAEPDAPPRRSELSAVPGPSPSADTPVAPALNKAEGRYSVSLRVTPASVVGLLLFFLGVIILFLLLFVRI